MKKLMFIAVAAIAGSLCAGDQIVSANVVGYAAKKLQNGFTGTAANFINVTGTARCLGDLVPVGYGDSYMECDIVLSKVNEFGGEKDGIFYTWYDGTDPLMGKLYGWYNDAGELCNDVELALGEGVMLQAPGDHISIQVSGQVYDKAVAIQLRNGFTLVGNPVPKAITLGNAVPSGYGASYGECDIVASKLDAFGAEKDGIFWTWYDCEDPLLGTLYGWYNDDGDLCNSEPLGVGEAIFLQAPDDTIYLNFPKAF